MYKFIQVAENFGHNDVARTLLLTIVYVEVLGYKDSMFYFAFPFLHIDDGNSIYTCKPNFIGYINYMVENKILPKKLLSFDLEHLFNQMYYELDHSIDYKLLKTLCKYKLRRDQNGEFLETPQMHFMVNSMLEVLGKKKKKHRNNEKVVKVYDKFLKDVKNTNTN
ncbi:hypothetical protein KY334_03370 [Candidatus Woesearchaeota archaeon]|nr:hypothetical protein [Candidatus Woesearchaeota archaeon]